VVAVVAAAADVDTRMLKARSSWFVYLIECRDGSLYTGIAVDVARRYAEHLAGTGARYTRSHPPLRLLGQCTYPGRSEASSAEYRIKQLTPAQKRALCAAWGTGTDVVRDQNDAHSDCGSPHTDTAQTSMRR
jgi:putative endonuclease